MHALAIGRSALALAVATAWYASAAPAQSPPAAPARPTLAAGADTNDWSAYYDLAITKLRYSAREADAGFYWASRLDPSRAEPLFGRWVAFWLQEPARWPRYAADDRSVLASPDVARADSLQAQALMRNPFVRRGLELVLYERLPGAWDTDDVAQGWLAYAQRDYARTAECFGRAIARDAGKHYRLWPYQALALAADGQAERASAELTRLLEEMRSRARRHVGHAYESTAFVEYVQGMLHWGRGDVEAAKASMRRAVGEDRGFYPAHAALGGIALAEWDTATAIAEYARAVELQPADATLRLRYGSSLYHAARPSDAAREFALAIRLEPFYADGYFHLAAALEETGERPAALRAYNQYIVRAPRSAAERIELARKRIAALTATASRALPGGAPPVAR